MKTLYKFFLGKKLIKICFISNTRDNFRNRKSVCHKLSTDYDTIIIFYNRLLIFVYCIMFIREYPKRGSVVYKFKQEPIPYTFTSVTTKCL